MSYFFPEKTLHKYGCRVFAVLLVGMLTGCLSTIRDQLDQCTATANDKYPANKPIPMGQPFSDILTCMQAAGYVIDYNGTCKYRSDYTSMASDPYCYRPAGTLSGYFHDVFTTLR